MYTIYTSTYHPTPCTCGYAGEVNKQTTPLEGGFHMICLLEVLLCAVLKYRKWRGGDTKEGRRYEGEEI